MCYYVMFMVRVCQIGLKGMEVLVYARGVILVSFFCVCAACLSQPLTHYSQFCGHL